MRPDVERTELENAQFAAHWEDDGWFLAPGFVGPDTLETACEELELSFPTSVEFAGDPDQAEHKRFGEHQWAGIATFPFPGTAVNNLVVYPRLIDLAERILLTTRIRIYQAALWAKFGMAIDYSQRLHVDYRNHTLVVPSEVGPHRQLQVFIYLSDVNERNGPTFLVDRPLTRNIPLEPSELEPSRYGDIYRSEVPALGPAGSLLAWGPDVFHRGSAFKDPLAARYMLMVSFCSVSSTWMGYSSWPRRAHHNTDWPRFVSQAPPRALEMFGFPPPGHDYWTDKTLPGVARRYPDLDLTPWIGAMKARRQSRSAGSL